MLIIISIMRVLYALLLALAVGCHHKTTVPEPQKNADGSHNAASVAWVIVDAERGGFEVEFVDVVHTATQAKSEQCYLNFGGAFPNQTLSVWWPKSYVRKGQLPTFFSLEGKRVKVSGRAEAYKGKPEVVIHSMDDVLVVEQPVAGMR